MYIFESPDSTVVNPDTHYSPRAWNNPGNSRDSNAGTFADILTTPFLTGGAYRLQTVAHTTGSARLVGFTVDHELIKNAGNPQVSLRLRLQTTPGVTIENVDIYVNQSSKARATETFYFLAASQRPYTTLAYGTLLASCGGSTGDQGTPRVYEVQWIYQPPRLRLIRQDG